MPKDIFKIDDSLTHHFKAILFCIKSRKDRDFCRQLAINVLHLTYERDLSFVTDNFNHILTEISRSIEDAKRSLIIGLCNDSSSDYIEWRRNIEQRSNSRELAKREKPIISSSLDAYGMHGGSGHTGRLKIGVSSPFGSESFQSDDDPRDGLKHWVKAVTAGGNGAGYSLSELSGRKEPKRYGAVISPEEFRDMNKEKLISVIDTATSPGNFLRAVLTYYDQRMIFSVGNININSANINNPENLITMSNLDSVYRFIQRIDSENIITPVRATRFLVLCNDLLELVNIPLPRGYDKIVRERYFDRERELTAAKQEITSQLRDSCQQSNMSPNDMRKMIDSDRRNFIGNTQIERNTRRLSF